MSENEKADAEARRLCVKAKWTRLLNPADRECSPEVYIDPFAAELAAHVERLLAERDRLRAAIRVVCGSLVTAAAKDGDAPCSAEIHRDEALRIAEMALGEPLTDTYGPEEVALRRKVGTVQESVMAENAQLRAKVAELETELAGEKKANALMNAGMGAVCEGRDELKHRVRELESGLKQFRDAWEDASATEWTLIVQNLEAASERAAALLRVPT